mmetsp:Transcript_6556/g.12790  ORF Transcript_6556/g.12790 Transcript_6556/m.12790 type:complete len:83 (+) Transcript_6556:116-364(+)
MPFFIVSRHRPFRADTVTAAAAVKDESAPPRISDPSRPPPFPSVTIFMAFILFNFGTDFEEPCNPPALDPNPKSDVAAVKDT